MNSEISFGKLPPEYKRIIARAEEKFNIEIKPLQVLVGGWSGAMIYLVSVVSGKSKKVEHLVLKLDRKKKMSTSDEMSRHQQVLSNSPKDFASQHIPEIVYEGIEDEDVIAIFYTIAGQSLRKFRTLSSFSHQNQLESLFSISNHYLLDVWNSDPVFEQIDHPQGLMKKWLGFRLDEGQKIEKFISDVCGINPSTEGVIVEGNIFPNPLLYAREVKPWGSMRPVDAILGFQHSDLNTNNILAKFSENEETLEGYFLIDFALYKENIPLLYDQRYLEMSYLVHAGEQGSFDSVFSLISQMAEHDVLESQHVPIEMAGVNAAVQAGRLAFKDWVSNNHPTLYDDLWGQYWLAGAAAGLSYCHKAGQSDEIRLAGLVYAAVNLKQFFNLFGVSMPTEAVQLYSKGQITSDSEGQGGLSSSAKKPKNNLPSHPTKFIGRETELREITDLVTLPETRLVTLTGPGGMGKTRLGLKSCQNLQDNFPDGVYIIELAAIRDPELFASTTAQTLGVREGGGGSPLENLKNYLENKEILLMFDNFEQITDAASDVANLLAAAPGLKGLITSRIPLHLRGEHEYPLSPLAIPLGLDHSLEEIDKYEAVALFRQHAQMVQPSFEMTEKNSETVVEICRRLDGLPLAIEIAASRIKMLSPEAMLKKLDKSMKLLVGGAKDLPDRQQTLRGAIDWSYELLTSEERNLYVRLGIFAGGFTLEAAEQVCNPTGEIDVFTGVETLLNNSLVRQVKSDGEEPRFDMLQTIRDFALEVAEKDGILEEMRKSHSQYYSKIAMDAEIIGSQAINGLKQIAEEQDNLRMTLEWSLQHEEGIPQIIPGFFNLTWFWYRNGHFQEGQEWTERGLTATEGLGDSPLRVMSVVCAGYMSMWTGDLIRAAERGRDATEMSERLRFDEGLFAAKLGLGTALINQGRDKEAYSHFVDAVELSDQSGQYLMKSIILIHLANVSLGLGDSDQAIQWLDMAMENAENGGDDWVLAFALNNYGEVSRVMGDYEKAEELYRQTEELYEQADAKGDQARLVNVLGYIAQHKGNFEEAYTLFLQGLEDFRELGNQRGIAECLAGLAGLAAEQGKYEWAAALLSSAENQLHAFDGAWWPADRVEIERARERMQTALGDEFEGIWTEGEKMGVEEALIYVSEGM